MQQQITRPAAIPQALIIVERLYALHYNKFKLFQQVSYFPSAKQWWLRKRRLLLPQSSLFG